MKKLMIALSAVASAFALYADATTIASEDFNAATTVDDLTAWSGLGESSISSTAYTQHDANPAAGIPELAKIAETSAGKNLAIKTPLTAPAYLDFTETSMAGVYFDSLVKFTACDEDATVVTDAKIMVWTKELTSDSGDVTGTNLMVTAGFFGTGDALEPKVYDCGSITAYGVLGDGNDWCRLTIKAIADMTGGGLVPGFVVFVNGKPATIAGIGDALKIGLDGSETLATLTKSLKIRESNHNLFPSMVETESTISAIGFAGQGAVDDVEVYSGIDPTLADGETPFTHDPDPVYAKVNDTDCHNIDEINAAIANAASGATVVLVDDVTGDLTFNNGAANTLNLGAFTLNGGISADGAAMLTIDGTGTVEGNLWSGDAKFVLNGGKYNASENEEINDNAVAKEGFYLKEDNGYYVVSEILEDGTAAKPWQISSAEDIQNKLIAKGLGTAGVGVFFKQTQDIDLSGTTWSGIGTYTEGTTGEGTFTGTYDGNGCKITGVKFGAGKYLGFFNEVSGAVSNLTVQTVGFDAGVTGNKGAAAVVGYLWSTGKLLNVTAEGEISGGTHNCAGVVVRIEDGATLENVTNKVNVSGTYTKLGGIACLSQNKDEATPTLVTVFKNCVNEGNITATSGGADGVGGILGYTCNGTDGVTHTFENCVNTGTITGVSGSRVGTMIGWSYSGLSAFAGTNKAQADKAPVGDRLNQKGELVAPVSGLTYATVESNVATFIADDGYAVGGTYKVYTAGAPIIELKKGESIAFDTTFATIDAKGITAATGYKVVPTTAGNVTTYTCAELVKATAPQAATGLVYDSTEKTGVAEGTGYTLTGNTATDAGSYQATATLAEGYDCWSDDTTEPKTIDWSIAQATTTITTAPTASADIVKDAALSTISLVGGVASTAGAFAWTTPETTVAEDGEFDVTFTPTDTKNYSTATCKVAVKVQAGQQDWPDDPEDVKDKTAGEAFGLTGELANAAADKVAAWAKEHDVAFGDKATINVKAMLLNIANDGDVAAAEADVKFTAEDLAALMAGDDPEAFLEKYPYATVTIGTYADAACTTEWTEGDQKFYKATLTVPQAPVKED